MYEIYQKLLDEKKLKNSDVSRATGISNMTLSDWKRGKTKPKTDTMKKIANFLGVSLDYLMGNEIDEYSDEMAEKDKKLRHLPSKIKDYALILSEMPEEQQEHIMSLIDMLNKSNK